MNTAASNYEFLKRQVNLSTQQIVCGGTYCDGFGGVIERDSNFGKPRFCSMTECVEGWDAIDERVLSLIADGQISYMYIDSL